MLLPRFAVEWSRGVVLFLIWSSVMRSAPAPISAEGARVYQKICADCHGKTGEGVEGKYAESLYGDWSLPKLTSYIAKNMPDDDPESLSPAQSKAVAAYVFDAFYSRAAQARNHPARVELAHLTNRQHVITLADLVRRFGGKDEPLGEARGLTATYYSTASKRADFDRSKLAHRGVDARISFDFAEGSPDRVHVPTGEFSVHWQGALLADETGDYEFVLRSPHSVRLWVNSHLDTPQPSDALVDAFVMSPLHTEHRVTVRLIGGRQYPIRLDCWVYAPKPNEKPAGIVLAWKPPHGTEQTIPTRNLAPIKVEPTFVATTPFPPDDSSLGYARGVAVSKAWDDATTSAAFEAANHVVKHLDRFAHATAAEADRLLKLQRFAERWVEAAFRRPISEDERTRWVTNQFSSAPSPETAVKRVVLLALKSPQFLYPNLPSDRDVDYAIASRISYAAWDSLPDEELLRAAAEGRLRSRDQVLAQANRMLAEPRARAKMRHFLYQWLQIGYVDDLQKDPVLFPEFTPEVVADLRTSLNLFLDDVVWNSPSGYRDLLLADFLFVNDRLARFYGVPAPAPGEFARVTMDAAERSGVITHPYLLAAFSYKNSTSPIHRGVFLTRNIVGRALKSPPIAVAFNDAEFAPNLTMREKVAKLTRPQSCQSCHAVINPLGFSLEWYDPVGRFRQVENGRAIDAISSYLTDDGVEVRLTGARDVAEFAANSEHAHHAFIEQLFHQTIRQPLMAYGPEALGELRRRFVAADFNLPKLLAEIIALAALHDVTPAANVVTVEPHRTP